MNNNNMNNTNNEEDIRIEKDELGNEKYIFDPYNPLNIEIKEEEIRKILKNYGVDYKINNFVLYKRAFIHKSYLRRPDLENENNNIIIVDKPDDCLGLHTKSNERLEFVGDGVLECITKYYLYKRFPKENEGFMTEKKIALVKNESIGKIAYDMGLHKWLIMSKHTESKQTRTNLKKLGCLFESFIGALFLDFNKVNIKDEHGWFDNFFSTGPGFQMVQKFVENIFEKHVDWIGLVKNDDNYKNILQVKIQKEFKTTPYYMEISEYNQETGYNMGVYLCLGQNPTNIKHFESVSIKTYNSYADIHQYMSIHKKTFIYLGEGTHKIKKKAEQIACNTAIENLINF
jgi:dsRNA-specific ribonuclease